MPWMTQLWNTVAGFPLRPLHQITIPGTHDSGCYVDHTFGNYFSRTQTQTIAQQLAGGVRYFDLRPYQSNYTWGRQFWTFHGPKYTGGRLDGNGGILDQVSNFMNGLVLADRELVILNISHFGFLASFGTGDHVALINEIVNRLGNHLVQHTQSAANNINLFNATYTALLTDPVTGAIQSRVAIIYDGALDTAREAYVTANVNALPAGFFTLSPKYTPAANPISLFDQYANSGNLGVMQANQLAKLRNRGNYPCPYSNPIGNWAPNAVGGVPGILHLFSWTLTPQPYDPIIMAQTSSNPALLSVFSNIAGGWLGANGNYDPAADPKINIVYVDAYESQTYQNHGSPFNGLAVPVAFAAQLNIGPIVGMNW